MGVTRRRFVRDLGAISVGLPLSTGIFASILETGFEIKPEGNVRCLATDSAGVGYESSVREAGAVGSRFSRLLTEYCDYVISIGVLKDHGIAGVSGCMKNFYGVIRNPNKYHPDGCDPYVADLYQSPLVGGKHKLSILDGLVAVYSGGPGYKPKYRWEYKGLVIGVDAVAVDRVGLDLIERKRKKRGPGESDLAKIKAQEMAV